MTSKGKQRTPPDLMNELLGSLQEDVPLPGQRPPEPDEPQESTEQLVVESTELHVTESTEQLVDRSSGRLVDLSARPQSIKTQTRKRDGTELTRKTHYLTPEQVRALKEFAFMTGTGESEVVRQALDEFFAQHGHEVWAGE
jgi:hypothetical protein